jgi:NitT/TauT family transport system substrate-binding protein
MPCEHSPGSKFADSLVWRYGVIALGWLVVISLLHHHFNGHHKNRTVIRMGYMPVITNLAAPLLDHASEAAGEYRFLAVKFASFAEMAEALRHGHIDVAFIIAPLAIVLKQQGEDVKIVAIGNRHESTLVVRKGLKVKGVADLAGRTLAVPTRYSGHYLEVRRLMDAASPETDIHIVEMNPPDMAAALATGVLDAYFVGEPFAAQTLCSGDAEVLFHVEEISPDFICNLILVHQRLIEHDAQAVQQLVSAAARSGMWAKNHPAAAARIASRYWHQPRRVIAYALTTPADRIVYDRFVPEPAEIKRLADMMVKYGLTDNADIRGLVEQRFAAAVEWGEVADLGRIIED